MKMMLAVVMAVLVAAQFSLGFASPTSPAFMWSSHQDGLNNRQVEAVDYRMLEPKDLAKSVLTEGGWSRLLCSREESHQALDFAILFVGKELHSADILTKKTVADPLLVDLLKLSVANSNFSLAFPYVASSQESNGIEASLVTEFENTCGKNLCTNDIAVLESCSLDGERFQRIQDMSAVQDILASKMEKRSTEQSNLIVICQGGSQREAGLPMSEAQLLSEVVSTAERLDAKYAVLYVSDPSLSGRHHSDVSLKRFLAESNLSTKPLKCDEVCQIKSSLLEGLFVAIVLLIILVSGLCCMAGIDTPTRFEMPQDS